MPGKNKTALLGWHPSSAEDAAWIRDKAREAGRGALARMLDQALAEYRARQEAQDAPAP
jgi:hypothetical protein